MKREDWIVGDHAIRPAGSPDRCFYCYEPRGGQHKEDCVLRERSVIIRMTVEYVVLMPESWTAEDIESFHNGASWCATNALDDLSNIAEINCLCETANFTYVREATLEDEKRDGVFVWEAKS